jgi:predicted Zn-dependent protease
MAVDYPRVSPDNRGGVPMRFPIFVLLLTALTATAQTRQATPNFYSREKEMALGAAVAQQFLRTATPFTDPAALDYVQRLGARLTATLPEPRFPYNFTLVATDENNALHEPFSFPGGYIAVPASLFLTAQDEGEFAGMLAHAMAHVQARHGTREVTNVQLEQIRTGTKPLVLTGGAAGFGPRQDGLPYSLAALEQVFGKEADLIAVRMTSAAGFDPQGLVRYIGRNADDSSRDERVSGILSAIQQVAPANSGEEFLTIQSRIRAAARQ